MNVLFLVVTLAGVALGAPLGREEKEQEKRRQEKARWGRVLDHTSTLPGAGIPNHNPLFDRGSDLTVVEDSGVYGPQVWATNIVDGDGPIVAGRPTNSGTQGLFFTVVATDPTLFSSQPVISDTGLLTFTPAPDQCGATPVSVELRDTGNPACVDGIPSNGVPFVCPGACSPTDCHVSVEVEFVITIECVNDPPRFVDLGDFTSREDGGPIRVVNWAFNINKGAGDSRAAITNFELEQLLTFTVTNNNNPLFTIQPTILWDAMNPSTADLVYTAAPGMCGTAVVTVELRDNGGTNNGGSDTMAPVRTFTITVTCDNDPPSFTCGNNIVVDEDAGPVSVAGWASQISKGNGVLDASENTQNLFFDLEWINPDNANLFLVPPSIDTATGTLTFTARPDANTFGRVVELYVRLRDDGGDPPNDKSCDPISTCCRLSIVINAINDPPSYTCGPDIIVCEDLFNLDVPPTPPIYTDGNQWATNINIGAVNEGVGLGYEGQTLQFSLVNTNPSLFVNGPAIDAAGTLTFQLAPNANGIASVTVNSRDTGPAGPPGSNRGPTCTFTITVRPVSDAPTFTLPPSPPLVVTEDDPAALTDWPAFVTAISRGPPDESGQVLSFTVTNDNNKLFKVQPHIDLVATSTARLSFELAPDMCGVANLDILLSDDGDVQTCNGKGMTSTRKTYQIKVDCVNDIPTFHLGPVCCAKKTTCTGEVCAILLCEDEAVNGYVQSSFATLIRAGPDVFDENQMSVAFTVTTDNNNLFSSPPTISPSGTLSFTTAPHAYGDATLTVTLTDDGSPARTSEPENYVITVRPSNDPPTFAIKSDLLGTSVTECLAPYDPNGCTLPTVAQGCARSFPNWISDINPGMFENTQGVTFDVSVPNDAASLFTVPPSVDPTTGTLSFTTKVGANTVTPMTLTITAKDDGSGINTAACPGSDTTVKTMQLEILPVNNAPCFTCGKDVTVLEDRGAFTKLTFVTDVTAGPADEAAQQLSFTLTPDKPTLFTSPPVIDPGTGTLSFTPGPNQCGTTEVHVMLDDGQASNNAATCKFTINVLPVNDKPTFSGLGEVAVDEDSGSTCVQWVKESSAGPLESFDKGICDRQTLRYELTHTEVDLFDVAPTLSPDGELCFRSTKDVCGISTVSVTLIDSGGVEHSGVDRSDTQTFPLNIKCVNDAPSFRKGTDVVACEDDGPQTVPNWCSDQTPGPLINENCPPHQQQLTFTLTVDNPALFTIQPTIDKDTCTLTFTPAPDANGVGIVTVLLCDDGSRIPPNVNCAKRETFPITLQPVNDAPYFRGSGDIVIQEDAPPFFSPVWAKSISKGPSKDPGSEGGQALEFIMKPENPALFRVPPAISPITGDLTFTLAQDANGQSRVEVCLKDDGGVNVQDSCLDGVDTYCQDMLVTVEACNDPPQFLQAGNVEVAEDAGPVSFARWMEQLATGPLDERHQVLKVVSLETPAEFEAFFSQLPAVSPATGDLTFTPAADAFGVATVNIVLQDNGGTANGCQDTKKASFTINIKNVNDIPSFRRGMDVSVLEDSGRYAAEWATMISRGPNEDSQGVRFEVVPAIPDLFTEQPAVSPEGVLSFTPALNQYGTTSLSVRLIDTGNGNSDTSDIQVFSIEIVPVNDVPTFSKGADISILEDTLPQCVEGWATDIMAGPPNEKDQTVEFRLTSRKDNVFESVPTIDSATGDLCFNLKPDVSGEVIVDIVAVDSSGAESRLTTVVFFITSVNDAPGFTMSGDVAVLEDSGAQIWAGWAKDITPGAYETGQALTFTTTSNLAAFTAPPKVWPATGDLTFTPAPDVNGVFKVDVTLSDNGGVQNAGRDSTTAFFYITITPVNDRPAFTIGADMKVVEDSLPVIARQWATNIVPGPADEVMQKLTFTATHNRPGMFKVPPYVTSGGDVGYTLAADTNGQATVMVVLVDDGGTAHGGIDRTEVASFTIDVQAVEDPPRFTPGVAIVRAARNQGQVNLQWATQVAGGPPDEAQDVVFETSVTQPSLFSSGGLPTISPTGVLSFVTAPGVVGNTSVVIIARDPTGLQALPAQLTIIISDDGVMLLRAVLDTPRATFDQNIFKNTVSKAVGASPSDVVIKKIDPDTVVEFTMPAALGEAFLVLMGGNSAAAETVRRDIRLVGLTSAEGVVKTPVAVTDDDDGSALAAWVIALIVLSGLLLICLGVGLFVLFTRAKDSKDAQQEETYRTESVDQDHDAPPGQKHSQPPSSLSSVVPEFNPLNPIEATFSQKPPSSLYTPDSEVLVIPEHALRSLPRNHVAAIGGSMG